MFGSTLIFLVTEDRYFVSHRLTLARRAIEQGYRVIVATRNAGYVDSIVAAGCEVVTLPSWRRDGGMFSEFRTLLDVARLYRRERHAVVHHVALKGIIMGSLAARIVGMRRVVNAVTGLGYAFTDTGGNRSWLAAAVRFLLRRLLRGTAVILQNEDDLRELVAWGVMREQQATLIRGVGVDLSVFRYTAPTPGIPIVAFVARIIWDKGAGEFVEAAQMLKQEGVAARFVMVGATDPANRAAVPQDRINHWVSAGLVEHWGHQTDMPGILAQSHIVCLPSYREGLPKALLEAGAAGRPVISTDVPGCRDVVHDQVNGLLVPPRDARALANAIRSLVLDPSMRDEMGRRGRKIAEEKFDALRVADETLRVYAQLGSGNGRIPAHTP